MQSAESEAKLGILSPCASACQNQAPAFKADKKRRQEEEFGEKIDDYKGFSFHNILRYQHVMLVCRVVGDLSVAPSPVTTSFVIEN